MLSPRKLVHPGREAFGKGKGFEHIEAQLISQIMPIAERILKKTELMEAGNENLGFESGGCTIFGLALVEVNGERTAALVKGEEILNVSQALSHRGQGKSVPFSGLNTLELLQHWDIALEVLEKLAEEPWDERHLLNHDEVRWLPPVYYPEKILCAGANYADHIIEMGGTPHDPATTRPFFFLKSAYNTLVGHEWEVILPRNSQAVDWEVELAVVIGKQARHVSEADALDYVAAYTIFNDVSARDWQRRTDSRFPHDWVGGKCFDTSGPLGPVMIPAKFIPDWRDLRLRLIVNDEVKQDALAGGMIHSIPQQIAFLSEKLTLQPGDIIATGTPAGVGAGRGEFLNPGDEMMAEIKGIGRLINRCVAEH